MSDGGASSWKVEHRVGAGTELVRVAKELDGSARRAWVMRADRSALVLGSTQRADPDDGPQPVPVVRRRSGGGAVLIEPGAQVWIEVWLPRSDRLWDDDVARSFAWVGETWARTLAVFGIDAEVRSGRLDNGRWGRAVCFAGFGPGEVFVGGRKVVGIAQRRTREGARFSCSAAVRFDAEKLLRTLVGVGVIGAEEVDPAAAADVDERAAGLALAPARLEAAFLGQLASI